MDHEPVYELTRGNIVESIHFGAAAVVDSFGNLLFSRGDPGLVTFLRSSAKPFQLLPFIQKGGKEKFELSNEEVSIMCASHSGTDQHVAVLEALQRKLGVTKADLMCGTHYPFHVKSADALKIAGVEPTEFHHNCSGKHTGMLAHALLEGAALEDYVSLEHPVQKSILTSFAELCNFEEDQIEVGIDGCSAPNFALPLFNAALGYARLCDPRDLDPDTASACDKITTAMTEYPFMVAGPDRFDTAIMEAAGGKIVAKGGAEGFMSVGIKAGALFEDSPGIGIAIKISDGDGFSRAREAFAIQVLEALNALTPEISAKVAPFGPELVLRNFRQIEVGRGRPAAPVEITWK